MSILSFVNKFLPVIRYNNGSWWYNNNTANYKNQQYMQYYLSVYAVNACINIRANYMAKFKWGVQESQGINYDSPLLDIIKKPNPYQKSTVDFIKQFEIFTSVYGWSYQKAFGGDRNNPNALYNLNPVNVNFNNTGNKPLLVWSAKDVNNLKKDSFTYNDNGVNKTFYFKDVMPFYDIANGVCQDNSDYSMYTSPSKIQAILKNIDNLGLSIDGQNVIHGSIGREAVFNEGGAKPTSESWGISANKPMSDKSRQDRDNKLNNTGFLRSGKMRSFAPTEAIKHLDMSLRPKDFGLEDAMSQQESIIARGFGVPNEIYQAYKQGATFENQDASEVKFVDMLQESRANDLAETWTQGFGNENTPYVATADHLRTMQKEENKKADTAFKVTQSLVNLQKVGMDEIQAVDFLEGLGVNLNN